MRAAWRVLWRHPANGRPRPLLRAPNSALGALRAGLHCGPVVIGEMGTVKKEIALTRRHHEYGGPHRRGLSRPQSSGPRFRGATRQLVIPADITACSLGPVELRGKTPVELFVLHATAATTFASPTA